MTKLLDKAIDEVRKLSDAQQDLAAEVLLSVVNPTASSYRLTPQQVEEVKQIQRDLRAGIADFASEDEMVALWKKCGL